MLIGLKKLAQITRSNNSRCQSRSSQDHKNCRIQLTAVVIYLQKSKAKYRNSVFSVSAIRAALCKSFDCSTKPKFHLARRVTCRHDSTRSTCRACRAVLFQHGVRWTSCSARLYKFSRCYALTYTNPIMFRQM